MVAWFFEISQLCSLLTCVSGFSPSFVSIDSALFNFDSTPGSVSLVQSPNSQHSGPCVESSYSQGLPPAPSRACTFLLLGMQQNPSQCSCHAAAGLPRTPSSIHFAGSLFCSQICQLPHFSFIYFLPHRLQHLLAFWELWWTLSPPSFQSHEFLFC